MITWTVIFWSFMAILGAIIAHQSLALRRNIAREKRCQIIIETRRVEIEKIIRRGFKCYSVFYLDSDKHVIEHWVSDHNGNEPIIMDVPADKHPWMLLNKGDNGYGYRVVISSEIHICTIDDLSLSNAS